MKVNVKIIRAFSIAGSGGNPAGVVLNADGLSPAKKQAVAATLGIPETAFVGKSATADYKIDFYTPLKQIPHCGHATIATFSYLKQQGLIGKETSSKETIDGNRHIFFKEGEAFMQQSKPVYTDTSADYDKILSSLRTSSDALQPRSQPVIVKTGNSFLLVPVKDETTLQNIQPDFDAITQLSEKYNLIGYYLYTRPAADQLADVTTRMFAPWYGIKEEAATGMAAGSLACHLFTTGTAATDLRIEQGRFMQQPSTSLIKVSLVVSNGVIKELYAGGAAFAEKESDIEI